MPRARSVASKLLHQVTNGDKIVLEKLDQCIKTTHRDPNNEDYSVAIDYRYLVDDDSRNFYLLKDILEANRDATVDIMDQPVITTFTSRRWPKALFYTMATIYLMFVLTLTVYLLFTFSHQGSYYQHTFQDVCYGDRTHRQYSHPPCPGDLAVESCLESGLHTRS